MHETFILRDDTVARRLWALLRNNWPSMAQANKPLTITVQEYKARRNNDQNRLYWALLNQIAAQAWLDGKQYSADAWHEYYKRQYIGMEELPKGGRVGLSTATLSVSEFSDFINQVEAHAATDLGVVCV